MPGALHGVRVLDLTTMVAGPVATMMIADQGADVIKIESPSGDLMRRFTRSADRLPASFLSCNRNKRSLALDLKSRQGLEILKKLIATADVFVQNFRPGTIEQMGLGEEIVRGIRGDIIYVSISGFGDQGPYANQRAYDPVIQALSGLAEIQADWETGRPRMVRAIVADCTTALTVAQAITAALFAKERSGVGQHVRIAMLDAMIAYLWPEAMPSLTFVGEESDPSLGERGPDLVYATQDRYITAGAMSDAEWEGMCKALNLEHLIGDPRFKTTAARAFNSAERRRLVAAELEKWRADEVLPRLLQNDVPSAPVLSRFELLAHPQIKASGILEEHQYATCKVRQPRPAARFDRTPAEVRTLAPQLGQDNSAILGELGYSADEIAGLARERVLHGRQS